MSGSRSDGLWWALVAWQINKRNKQHQDQGSASHELPDATQRPVLTSDSGNDRQDRLRRFRGLTRFELRQ
jgi:hypothetical protein